jgi:hypothetical protein
MDPVRQLERMARSLQILVARVRETGGSTQIVEIDWVTHQRDESQDPGLVDFAAAPWGRAPGTGREAADAVGAAHDRASWLMPKRTSSVQAGHSAASTSQLITVQSESQVS